MENKENKQAGATVKDSFLDFSGLRTEEPINKKVIISFAAAIIVYIICSSLPIDSYGEGTARALGMLFGMITFSMFWPYSIAVPALMCAVVGVIIKVWDWSGVSSALGSSPMYTLVGMQFVALGCEFTPFGQRMAYTFLKKFAKKPILLVMALAFVTALISAFVSNLAVMIMMSGIAASLLEAMGEKPGESKIGRTLMMLVTAMTMIGGAVLICGSPSGNGRAIGFLESTANVSITFGQWAAFGIPSFIIYFVPVCFIYIKCTGLKSSSVKILPESYYDEKLKSLGPIGGSEIRWLLIVAGMIVALLLGMNTGFAALTFGFIAMLPVIGVVPPEKAVRKVQWANVLALCTFGLLGTLFSNTGLGGFVNDMLKPIVGNMSPVIYCMFACLITGLCVNLFVNANIAVCAMCITIFSSVCVSLGYNPTVIMAPSLAIVSFFYCMGANTMVLLNKGYGYWEMKDTVLPGFLSIILISIVYPLVTCVVAPIIGLSLYM